MLKIRQANEEDLNEVLRLYAQPDFDNGDVLPIEEARALYRRFFEYPDYKIYLAEIDGRVIGTFALLVMFNLGHCGAPSAIIEDIVVDPDMQGRGFGRDMMQAAMNMAREKNAINLSCRPMRAVHARIHFMKILVFSGMESVFTSRFKNCPI